MKRSLWRDAGIALCLLAAGACGKKPSANAPGSESPRPSTWFGAKQAPAPVPPQPPAEIWKEFSGEKAFAHVKVQVDMGPRPSGSPELERLRKYIVENVASAGWQVERQTFTDQTPRGPVEFTNLIARFGPDKAKPAPADTQRVIVASHYDTKIFDTIRFVGASDGASSTGALIELARVLALDWELARRVELVFFDGEEAVAQFDATDGLYGSRHYARQLRATKRNGQFRSAILWDMIGDRDLTITLSPDSPPELARGILAAAQQLGVRDSFSYHSQPIWDDHVPLNEVRIPAIDLIDFDYLPWHTADDTLDKLSPESLRRVAAVTLLYLKKTPMP